MCLIHVFGLKMPKNNIKELRLRRKITQHQLAQAICSSQQQIQRIEAGIQSVRVDLAMKICNVLNSTMQEVFPDTELPIARAIKRKTTLNPYENEILAAELARDGFDVDPLLWQFSYRLRGDVEGSLWISGADKKRLSSIIDNTRSSSIAEFIVFDSGNRRYALNIEHLIMARFMFEMPTLAQVEEKNEHEFDMIIYLANDPKPLKISVAPDYVSANNDTDYEDDAPLQELLNGMQELYRKHISFFDADGEEVYFRSTEISMLSLSLSVLGNYEETSGF